MWSIRFAVVSGKLNASCNFLLILGKCKGSLCISLRTRTFFWSSLLLLFEWQATLREYQYQRLLGLLGYLWCQSILRLEITTLLKREPVKVK